MKRVFSLFTLVLFIFAALTSFASGEEGYEGPAQWDSFAKYMEHRQEQDRLIGTSYLISGSVATIGGMIGYANSEDPFSRGVYAIAQSVGVAAIGYGASHYWIGNEYNSFFYAIDGASLTAAQRNEILQRYLARDQEAKEKTRWIKVITHSLVAAVNLYNSTREQDKNVRGVLQFLAGTNAVIAASYAF